jgi:hypothetical protein
MKAITIDSLNICIFSFVSFSSVAVMLIPRGTPDTSIYVKSVIRRFVKKGDGILFEILLHADAVAADIRPFSAYPNESEILIAASSTFRIEKVCEYQIPRELSGSDMNRAIPKVYLSSYIAWHDLDFD